MTTTASAIGLTIDGRTYRVEEIEQDGPEYETFECSVPDESWSATDANGHEHRYWRRGSDPKADLELPTLERHVRHIECDGVHIGGFLVDDPCEGYDELYWLCIVCGDEVAPWTRRGTTRTKVREGFLRVHTTIDPGELADDTGTVVLTSRPGAERHEGARLVWPAGAGRMLDVTGTAWCSRGPDVTYSGPGRSEIRQTWDLIDGR